MKAKARATKKKKTNWTSQKCKDLVHSRVLPRKFKEPTEWEENICKSSDLSSMYRI